MYWDDVDNKESINVDYKCIYVLNHHIKAVNIFCIIILV